MRKIVCALSLASALIFALAVHAAAPASFAGTWTLDKTKSPGLSQRIMGTESVSWVITQTDKDITIEEKVTGGQMGGGGGAGAPAGAAAGAPPAGAPPAGAPPAGAPPAGAPPAGGPPGGGPGGGRGGGMGGPRTFNLDGTDTTADMGRGKVARKATWSADQKTLELTSKNTFQGPDGEVTSTQTDKLELSADGKMLTVKRHSEGPRGPQDSTWVLTK
jgi:hypothetical protein